MAVSLFIWCWPYPQSTSESNNRIFIFLHILKVDNHQLGRESLLRVHWARSHMWGDPPPQERIWMASCQKSRRVTRILFLPSWKANYVTHLGPLSKGAVQLNLSILFHTGHHMDVFLLQLPTQALSSQGRGWAAWQLKLQELLIPLPAQLSLHNEKQKAQTEPTLAHTSHRHILLFISVGSGKAVALLLLYQFGAERW